MGYGLSRQGYRFCGSGDLRIWIGDPPPLGAYIGPALGVVKLLGSCSDGGDQLNRLISDAQLLRHDLNSGAGGIDVLGDPLIRRYWRIEEAGHRDSTT